MSPQDEPGDSTVAGTDGDLLVREHYDWSETPPSLGVVFALSTLGDGDPIGSSTETAATLSNYVDPEALDDLFVQENRADLTVVVSIAGYQVRIGDGKVVVSRPPS